MAEDKKTTDRDGYVKNKQLRDLLNNPVILKSEPTRKSLKANTMGIHGTDVFVRGANGKMIKLTGTEIEE